MTDCISATVRPVAGPDEYPTLVRIWRSAVDATHGFVRADHLDAIEAKLASDYLPGVELTVAECDGSAVGFSGVADGGLQMLFVDDRYRGRGIGTILVNAACARESSLTVDVNEQNAAAVGFYELLGFVRIGRSELDDDGLPYPLLHLRLTRQELTR